MSLFCILTIITIIKSLGNNEQLQKESVNIILFTFQKYLENCVNRFSTIDGSEPKSKNEVKSYEQFISNVIMENLSNTQTQRILESCLCNIANPDNSNSIQNYKDDCYCILPTSSPVESIFSLLRRHEHINSKLETNSVTTDMCYNVNSFGLLWWKL